MNKTVFVVVAVKFATVGSVLLLPLAHTDPVTAVAAQSPAPAVQGRCYEDFSCDSDVYRPDAWGWRIAKAGLR